MSKTDNSEESRPTVGKSVPRLSIRKKLLFSAVLTVVVFALLEIVLLVVGAPQILYEEDPYVGFSSQVPLFVEETGNDGQQAMATAKNKLTYFNKQRFPKQKAPGTYRVFCVGGSTTYGRPYEDPTSFPGWLREFLPVADSSRRWEVINAGGISYASYRVALLMEELTRYQPDLFIIYTGHNEFLERRTYGDLMEAPSTVRTMGAMLGRSRTYSVVHRLIRPPRSKQNGGTILSEEVNTVLDQSVGLDAYHRDGKLQRDVVDHFNVSLRRMIDIARSAGARVILVTPASKLKNCAPFKSEHSSLLAQQEAQQWQLLAARAEKEYAAGAFPEALTAIEQALAIDDRVAHLQFLHGRVLEGMNRHAEAKMAYGRAIDEDICPLRASTPIRETVVEVAASENVPLVNFVEIMERNSPEGIPGENLFFDHVHPTIEGNRLLGVALLEAMIAAEIVHPESKWGEAAISQVKEKVEAGINQETHGKALINLSQVLNWAGKVEESGKLAIQAAEMLPDESEAHFLAGCALAHENRLDEAKTKFQRAVELTPKFARAHDNLGLVFYKQEQFDQARQCFQQAIEIDPNYAHAHNNLGMVFAQKNELREAAAQFEKALQLQPDYPDASRNLNLARQMLSKQNGR